MSTADGQLSDVPSADDWASQITRSLSEHRALAQTFLQRKRDRFAQLQEQTAAHSSDTAPPSAAQSGPQLADQAALVAKLSAEIDQLQAELNHARERGENAADSDLAAELNEVHAEHQALLERLADAERAAAEARESPRSEQQYEDLRRRFEMAVEDVRELKAQNADLEEQLRSRGSASAAGAAQNAPAEGLDWEAQKQRLMNELTQFDEGNEVQDKLTIEGAIRITDQVVAEKEQQISDLKAQLKNKGASDEITSALTGMLDKDEAVREERERLKRLQDDWKQKLRKAEIEISVERAKLARERAKMEEQIQHLEVRLAQRDEAREPANEAGGSKKSTGRKWLSRLGLADDD